MRSRSSIHACSPSSASVQLVVTTRIAISIPLACWMPWPNGLLRAKSSSQRSARSRGAATPERRTSNASVGRKVSRPSSHASLGPSATAPVRWSSAALGTSGQSPPLA